MPLHLILPFAAAFSYALGSLLVKRALQEGASVRQAFHVGNLAVAVIFLPLLAFHRGPIRWELWWSPVAAALAFYLGALFNTIAIRKGDVSFVNPILGTKVVFVAFAVSAFRGQSLTLPVWIGAFLAAVGVFLMGGRSFVSSVGRPAHVLPCVGLALASAFCFATTDVLVAAWAPSFGSMPFVVLMTLGVAAASITVNPVLLRGGDVTRLHLRHVPAAAAPWLLAGSVIVAVQALLIALALTAFDDATGVNIAYSSRGLWSVILAGPAALWLGVSDAATGRDAGGRRILAWRFAGAVVLTVGIIAAVSGLPEPPSQP